IRTCEDPESPRVPTPFIVRKAPCLMGYGPQYRRRKCAVHHDSLRSGLWAGSPRSLRSAGTPSGRLGLRPGVAAIRSTCDPARSARGTQVAEFLANLIA